MSNPEVIELSSPTDVQEQLHQNMQDNWALVYSEYLSDNPDKIVMFNAMRSVILNAMAEVHLTDPSSGEQHLLLVNGTMGRAKEQAREYLDQHPEVDNRVAVNHRLSPAELGKIKRGLVRSVQDDLSRYPELGDSLGFARQVATGKIALRPLSLED